MEGEWSIMSTPGKSALRSGRSPSDPWAIVSAAGITVALLMLVVGINQAAASSERGAAAPNSASAATALPLSTTSQDFFLPGTQPNSPAHPLAELIDPTSCNTCHTAPIYDAWRGSMMGQAGRDPLFWSAFAVAQSDATDAGEFCLRCHAPRGWFAGRSDPADGSALTDVDRDAGVACETCHRLVDPVPGAEDEATAIDAQIRADLQFPPPSGHVGSGMLVLDPQDRRRGPFSRPFNPHPVLRTEFLGQGGNAVTESRVCGSCHNVDNPLLSWTENPPGGGPAQYWPNDLNAAAPSFDNGDLFPLERTFDEWRASDYANGGVYAPQFAGAKLNGLVGSCQDCHMVRQTGYAAEVFFNADYRDCHTSGCLPAHIFAGGNAWIPKILQDARWRLHNAPDAPLLDATAAAAVSMLQRAATVEVDLVAAGNQKAATVRVINETGHKLPTGYPEGRRMWLNLRAYDAAGQLVYESGAYNPQTGKLTEDAAIKVYEAKQGLTPEMAAVVGMQPGPTFHFALNNTVYKDNRIPPRGYTVAAYDRPGLRPVGATYADGQYWDDTTYNVPAGTVRVVARLYYQTASSDYIDFLAGGGGADGATLAAMWQDSKSPPVLVNQATFPAPNVSYIPLNRAP